MKGKFQKLGSLVQLPSFTSREARKRGVSAALLCYYTKIGLLEKLGHGVYRGIDAISVNDFRIEDLAKAIACVKEGVICLVSALALYELTEEIPRQHWIAISNRTRHRTDLTIRIIRMRNIKLGKRFIEINEIKLPIFDRERTIIDAFRYLGSETAIKSLRFAMAKSGKEKINFEKLRNYAKTLHVKIEPYLLALSI